MSHLIHDKEEIRNRNPKIAVFVSFSGQGGVERMMINLCGGLISLGCDVDLVTVKAKSTCLNSLPSRVRVVRLGTSHTLSSLPCLLLYLRRERPLALLAAKDRANQVAILARRMALVPTRVVVRMGTTVSAALAGKRAYRKLGWHLPMRLIYPLADEIISVSDGVAADMSKITGLPLERFRIIENPVVTPTLHDLAREPITHPWFGENQPPVLLAAGRLTRQKDFPVLIKAFSMVRAQRRCRLVILGEGDQRSTLESLAHAMGVKADIDLPGFVENPYAFMSRASLFVLSSAWEGSPNVLTEALALGVPSVATDCPSGPREILQDGRFGPLVPVGDADALAEAISRTLARPPKSAFLKEAAEMYSVEKSSRRYLEALLGQSL